jgi:predicted nuclease of restriction endonuclease-like (RecB) superfamily
LSSIPPTQQRFIEPEKPEDTFRDAYVLEFLGLKEKPQYSESDLEQAIIDNLQEFFEMGKRFCFETSQKRVTFG